jgi:hypothetical protein
MSMPARNHSSAPKFDGQAASLTRYLNEVHRLGEACSLSEKQIIEWTLMYADPNDSELWEQQTEGRKDTWNAFKSAVIELYPGADGDRKYSVNDLQVLVEDNAAVPVKNQNHFGEYYRSFLRISMFLKKKDRLSEREIATLFMQGLHVDFRRHVREQLRIKNPDHHPDDPWLLAEIYAAAVMIVPRQISTSDTKAQDATIKKEVFDMSNLGSGSHDSQWAETIVSTIIKKLNLSPDNGGYRARQLREMLCAFCSDREHFIRDCLKLVDYISKGWCKRDQDNQIVVADGTKVTPRLAPGRDIKERIDNWRKMNPTVGTVSTNVVEVHTIETSKIEEVDEKYIDTGVTYATKREMEDIEMYEALAATAMKKAEEVRKKSGAQGNGKSTGPTTRSMSSKEAEIGAAKQEAAKQAPTTRTHTSNEKQGTTPGQNGSQYKYVSAIEDPKIIEAVARRGLNSSMTLTMHELLAISPEIRKYTRDLISTKRVGPGTNSNTINVNHVAETRSSQYPKHLHSDGCSLPHTPENLVVAKHMEQLRAIDVELEGGVSVEALIDNGSMILALRRDKWEQLGIPVRADHLMRMQSANLTSNDTMGLLHNLPITIGGYKFYVQVQVVDDAPYELLLGLPFYSLTEATVKHSFDGSSRLTLTDPNTGAIISIPTKERREADRRGRHINLVDVGIVCATEEVVDDEIQEDEIPDLVDIPDSDSEYSVDDDESTWDASDEVSNHDEAELNPALVQFMHGPIENIQHVFNIEIIDGEKAGEQTIQVSEIPADQYVYKKVANRVKPVATTLPEDFRIVRKFPSDPLANLPELPEHPPEFTPGRRYTVERKEAMKVNEDGFLWPEEEKLVHYVIKVQEEGFAWDETEKGKFSADYFEPVVIPTVEHVPWVLRNIPIPQGVFDQVVDVIKAKIASGVYEPSNSSYRSRWFAVTKKDGKSIRIVHDLQPLNQVTIKDSGLPPHVEPYVESFGGRGCYGMFDLFVGFDQRELAVKSRDLTTFQTPLGTFRLTSIPMGYTNSMQIQHGDTTFLLQDEIPHVTIPFVDDIPVKGPATRYELPDGGYETIPGNGGIRRFVWEHLNNVNRVIQRIKHAGGTFSGLKSTLCSETAVIVGHRCTYEGRVPLESHVQKIVDWPVCENITDVRGFLGTLGTIRMFIKDYAKHAKPLVDLTRKNVAFEFGDEQLLAMEKLKMLAVNCPAIRAIDYDSDNEVILAVDSSWMAVGYVLSQMGDDGRRYPSRFGSITWNEREQRYSQAKIELYGLFRALKDVRLYILGVRNLVVEVDAQYIKGMINNPDMVPNAAANRWLAGILLFNFTLRHVPGKDHTAADGLSRRRPSEDDHLDGDDIDSWIDDANCFAIEVLNRQVTNQLIGEPRSGTMAPIIDIEDCAIFTQAGLEDRQMLASKMDGLELPRHEKGDVRDKLMEKIRDFLDNLIRPTDMDDQAFTRFVRQVSDFFLKDGQLWKKSPSGRHQLYIERPKRLALIAQAHDDLGHKGVYSVRMNILQRFWWPFLEQDVKWYIRTCHECQVRQLRVLHVPPTVPAPRGLFRKVYIDTMLMPKVSGYCYIVHARCSLTAYPEWTMLRKENATTIGKFIFNDILCRWGAVEEIVTDNAPQYIQAVEYLVEKYHIHYIRISPYNSRAQGPIERRHFDVRESIIKAADGDESRWPNVVASVFWAERVSIHKYTGYSPFYLAHGVEPLLPFDLAEATYLAPRPNNKISTTELIAQRAIMLQKRPLELEIVRARVQAVRWAAVAAKEKEFLNQKLTIDFTPGSLVLVRNSVVDKDLGSKTKPRYLGPMVVVRRTKGGSYILADLDGSLSKLRYAAFRIFPYYPRDLHAVPVTKLVDLPDEELDALANEGDIDDDDE